MTLTQLFARPMPSPVRASLAAALALGTALAFPAAAPAQTSGTDVPGAEIPDVGQIDTGELEAFARSILAVSELRAAYVDRLAAAASDAEQEALIEEGNRAMLATIEEQPGISVERFFEINAAAQTDPDLNERIVLLLQDISGEG